MGPGADRLDLAGFPGGFAAAKRGFFELSFLNFALEEPISSVDGLAAMVRAVSSWSCARRGLAAVSSTSSGFFVELYLLPPDGGMQAAAVGGHLFIPGSAEAVEAVCLLRLEDAAREPQRRRRRGRKS